MLEADILRGLPVVDDAGDVGLEGAGELIAHSSRLVGSLGVTTERGDVENGAQGASGRRRCIRGQHLCIELLGHFSLILGQLQLTEPEKVKPALGLLLKQHGERLFPEHMYAYREVLGAPPAKPRKDLSHVRTSYVRAIEQQRAGIIRSLQRLLHEQGRLEDARLPRAVGAGEDGQRAESNLGPFPDGFEAFDGDPRDPFRLRRS